MPTPPLIADLDVVLDQGNAPHIFILVMPMTKLCRMPPPAGRGRRRCAEMAVEAGRMPTPLDHRPDVVLDQENAPHIFILVMLMTKLLMNAPSGRERAPKVCRDGCRGRPSAHPP